MSLLNDSTALDLSDQRIAELEAQVRQGDARRAIEFYEQQLAIARETGGRLGEGNALWNMSLALDSLGERANAIARAEAALKIREEIEDPRAEKVRKQLAEWGAATDQEQM